MPCTGHCLDLAPIVPPSLPENSNEDGSTASTSEPSETYSYTHLKPWQTRVLRLHPSDRFSDGREFPLSADLLVVTVSDAEDFLIESTGATIEYTALSYSWGRPVLGKTLLCNGMMLPISGSNAAALVALRDPTEPTYVWVDAICINQEDALEKSAQVARMLSIYEKAQSVAVWLSEPNAYSVLAFACIQVMSRLQEEVSKFGQTTHDPLCWSRMKSIFRALLETRHYEATDPRDTFYAVLGMCNVLAFSQETAHRRQDSKGAVLVDYKKSLVEVYQDATLCILNRRGGSRNLANLWHPYKRGSLHGEGLPLWAVDWQSGTHEDDRRATTEEARELRPPLSFSHEANEQHTRPDETADDTGAWYWPQPLSSDLKILCLRARVLNYVAYLLDFTCEIGMLAEENSGRLGLTAWAVHGETMLRDPLDGHAIVYPNPMWKEFNPETHSRRLAILGVGNHGQLCLVPSTTRKGDLIVGISPGLLAMAISPMRSDRTIGGLIPQDDAYETITREPLKRSRSTIPLFLCDYSMLISLPFTVAFVVSLLYMDYPSSGATILMSCYCVLLLFLLLGHVASLYLHALDFGLSWIRTGLEFTSLVMQSVCSLGVLGLMGALFLPVAQNEHRLKVAGAWIGTSMVALLVGHSMAIHCRVQVHMAIASRRIDVFKTLDNVTEILGRDFEFHGPVFVRDFGVRQLSGKKWAQYLLRIRFVIDFLLKSRSKDRSYLGAKFAGMRSSVNENFSYLNREEMTEKRPVQEFRLH